MNIILLSGGSGKRLWPLSNDVRSKQFIKLFFFHLLCGVYFVCVFSGQRKTVCRNSVHLCAERLI